MRYPIYHHLQFFEVPKDAPAIRVLGLWCGLLVFFFSPDVIHAEFLDRLELIQHLRQGHYQKLEQIFTRQETLYQAKKIPEEHVEAAYYTFANSAADLQEKLDEWVTRNDAGGTSLLARGVYHWNIGWLARGGAYMSETPKERVRSMQANFALAWQDLQEAMQKKEHSGIPSKFLISIAMSLGDHDGIDQYTDQGLQADPGSFAVRWQHLYSLTPWWSSWSTEESLQAVEKFLQERVTPHVNRYPTLKPLLGFPDFMRAEMFDRNDDYEKALPHYQAAMKRGRYYYYAYSYGQALFYLDRDKEALDILTAALQDRPQVANLHDYRARTLNALNRPEQALAEQAKAVTLNELDPDLLEMYAWRLKQQGHIEDAEEALTDALVYGSCDHGILGDLGRLYLADLHDPERALPYLKKAIRLKPEKPWYWLNYGWALNELADCHAVEILYEYKIRCLASGNCPSNDIEWAKRTSQRMVWKEGCWREHPTLKLLGRLVKWLPGI